MIDFSKRTTSSFGVSIGTGLMLESLFKPTHPRYDETRVIPSKVEPSKYKYHFINLMTLARNICGSFNVKIDHEVIYRDRGFSECLNEEVNVILSLYAGTGCSPVFYYKDYDKLEARLNAGKTRPKTKPILDNSKLYQRLKKIDMKKDWLVDCDLILNVEKLPEVKKEFKCLMTTSFCIDTFAKMNLDLIDSHTGLHMEKKLFYKKYYQIGNHDMSIFPHYEILLYFIGDVSMSGIISPKIRSDLYGLASSKGWDYKYSEHVVRWDIKSVPDLRKFMYAYKKLY